MHLSREYPASGERQDRPEKVVVHNSGHVDHAIQISALDVFYEMGWSTESLHQRSFGLVSRVRGDDFVCLSDDDGLNHIDTLLKAKLNCVFRVGVEETGQFLEH